VRRVRVKILIAGSRDYPRLDFVRDMVKSFDPDTTVITGGARGVDKAAEEAAIARGLRVETYRPRWGAQGRGAGIIRNRLMVNACDQVVAFWDGKSAGTKSTIEFAKATGKPLVVYMLDGGPGLLGLP
jgi:predicted Rossmann fold nucleotide-binding protein DprA/Smf involved in DNA uptake